MNNIHKIGGFGALLMAGYFVWVLVFVIGVLPGQGLTTPEELGDPMKGLASWTQSPALYLLSLADLLIAVALALVVPALFRLMSPAEGFEVQIGTAAGAAAIPLFLASGMTVLVGMPQIVAAHVSGLGDASAAYLAVNAINTAIGFAGVFAFGWWLVLMNLSGLRTRKLSKPLALVGFVFGIACILFFAVQAIAPITLILGLTWSGWLAVSMLRGAVSATNSPLPAQA